MSLLKLVFLFTVGLAILIQLRLQATGVQPVASPLPELPEFAASKIHDITGQVELVGQGELVGPESLIESNGYLFAALGDGQIARLSHDENGKATWTFLIRTGDGTKCSFSPSDEAASEGKCGRPLGMKIVQRSTVDPNYTAESKDEDVLLIADAYKGLLMVTGIYGTNTKPSTQVTLATRANTDSKRYQFKLLNSLVQAPDKSIYFTETTQTFQRRRIFFAAFDGRKNGRLLRYTKDKGVEVVQADLYMPNGIALSHDRKNLLIVCGVQILRYSLKRGEMTVAPFASVLPGTGDNIDAMDHLPSGKRQKCYWAGLGSKFAKPFSLLKLASEKPLLKSILVALVPYKTIVNLIPKLSALAVYDEQGNLIEIYKDSANVFPWVSEGEAFGEYLYLGSWYNPCLARVKLSNKSY